MQPLPPRPTPLHAQNINQASVIVSAPEVCLCSANDRNPDPEGSICFASSTIYTQAPVKRKAHDLIARERESARECVRACVCVCVARIHE